jgi:hypothetical protein
MKTGSYRLGLTGGADLSFGPVVSTVRIGWYITKNVFWLEFGGNRFLK